MKFTTIINIDCVDNKTLRRWEDACRVSPEDNNITAVIITLEVNGYNYPSRAIITL